MIVTRAERRFSGLLTVWLVLFGGGAVVMTVAVWYPAGAAQYANLPLLTFVWAGQILLWGASWYAKGGLRDNELCAVIVVWYKAVAGTAMVGAAVGGRIQAGAAWIVLIGGLLDYGQGFLTFALWLRARASRLVRMPLVLEAYAIIDEEPGGPPSRRLRVALLTSMCLFGVVAIVLLVVQLVSANRVGAPHAVAMGNAAGLYAAMAIAGTFAWDAPRSRRAVVDVMLLGSAVTGIGLLAYAGLFVVAARSETILVVVGALHLGLWLVLSALSWIAGRAERPTRVLGPWLHSVLEEFAEVIIHGRIEVVTPREVADRADELLSHMESSRRSSVKLALAFIELGSVVFRRRPPMSRLGRPERVDYLRDTFQRGTGVFRDLIKVKQLIYLLYYADKRVQQEIGFIALPDRDRFKRAMQEGKVPTDPVQRPATGSGATFEADVCVIGSGAGGAVVAARLAKGRRVVILEEGPLITRGEVTQDELAMQLRAYRSGGLQTSLDLDMYVLQGRCVGGSTFVNNGILFEAPTSVLAAWENLGARVPIAAMQQAYARIREDLRPFRLADRTELAERGSHKFLDGCRRLGLAGEWFELNLDGCIGCGYCTSGCAFDKKMSMDATFIPTAVRDGAVLVPDCRVERIDLSGRRAKRVRGCRSDGSWVTVEAKHVVVACGAIHSSLLLQRSGIRKNVGTRVSFNAGSWVFAEFPDPVDSFDGVQMCAYHAARRFFMETLAMPPGAFAVAMPGWFESHFERMMRYRHFAVAGALIPTEPTGTVAQSRLPFVGGFLPPLKFTLSVTDLRKLRDGVAAVGRVWFAAGATRVVPATFRPLEFSHPNQLFELESSVVEPDDLAFGSAHPQGGNPMSDDPEVGVVSSDFRVHGLDNVSVVDASVFPSALGVNPQLTIMAMAHRAAERIAAQLGGL